MPQDITRVLVIRHGETAWNRESRIQGHIDIPLNDHGRWQAERVGQALLDEPLAAIYSSDLARALDTARSIAQVLGLDVGTDRRLRERGYNQSMELARPVARARGCPLLADGLARLRRRFVISTLSNAGMRTMVAVVKHAGLPFDAVLTAELARTYQPSPSVYQLAVDLLGYQPEEIMMVACHKYDLKAARAMPGVRLILTHAEVAHLGDLLLERQFLGDRLERGESHRQAGFAADLAHPAKFVPFAAQVAGHFEHAVANPAHGAADLDQLFLGGGGAGDQFAVDRGWRILFARWQQAYILQQFRAKQFS